MVGWRLDLGVTTHTMHRLSRELGGADEAFPITYGLAAKDLVELLTQVKAACSGA